LLHHITTEPNPEAAITWHYPNLLPSPHPNAYGNPSGKTEADSDAKVLDLTEKNICPWLAKSRIMIVLFHWPQHTLLSPSLVKTHTQPSYLRLLTDQAAKDGILEPVAAAAVVTGREKSLPSRMDE
jgi:hypothetical protein